MNRKIEFRAWQNDGEYSRMIYSIQGVLTALRHTLGEASAPSFSSCNNQPDKNRYELMEWTGLKDSNGEKIFEGDIIETYFRIDDETFSDIGTVIFSGFAWQVKLENGDLDTLNDWTDFKIEVIGNIYEI